MAMATTESPDSRRYQCCVLCNLMQYETSTHCLSFHENMSSLADPNFFLSLQYQFHRKRFYCSDLKCAGFLGVNNNIKYFTFLFTLSFSLLNIISYWS